MDDVLAKSEMGFCLVLLLLSWLAGSKASRLLNSGSVERLHRKTRKLMFRIGYLSLAALAIFVCIGSITAAMPPLFWEDRILLHAPLIGAPLLAVWFIAMPKLWKLWKETQRIGGILDNETRCRLAGPGIVLPFQATAIGAASVFYFAWVSPVLDDPLEVAVPLFAYMLAMAGLWMLHDRRWRQVVYPGMPVKRHTWQRALRLLGIL